MIKDWTKNLQSDIKAQEFERMFNASGSVLDRLTELVEEREYSMDVFERGLKQFESPNWAERQAFNNGMRSAFNIVKTLIARPKDDRPNGFTN